MRKQGKKRKRGKPKSREKRSSDRESGLFAKPLLFFRINNIKKSDRKRSDFRCLKYNRSKAVIMSAANNKKDCVPRTSPVKTDNRIHGSQSSFFQWLFTAPSVFVRSRYMGSDPKDPKPESSRDGRREGKGSVSSRILNGVDTYLTVGHRLSGHSAVPARVS